MGNATVTGPAPGPQAAGPTQAPVGPINPFVRASSEHVQPAALDESVTMTAAAQDLGQVPIPAFGYLRSIVLLVTVSGGAKGDATVAAKEDAPWSVLKSVSVTDVNGGQLVGPLNGYELMLVNKLGGYLGNALDPASSPAYSAVSVDGNTTFMLRVPVELAIRDAVGALPNANSSATFKLNVTVAGSGDVYGTAPDTLPSVRVQAWQEAWAQPEPALSGVLNEMQPPATGTTSFWNRQVFNVSASQQSVQLTRLGNYIRNLIFICRTTAPARSDSMWPDPMILSWDSVQMLVEPRFLRKHYMRERFGLTPDTGVFAFDFTHDFDGIAGAELRDLWLPTLTSSRIEFSGVFGAAGTVTVLTNDVAVPAGDSIFTD